MNTYSAGIAAFFLVFSSALLFLSFDFSLDFSFRTGAFFPFLLFSFHRGKRVGGHTGGIMVNRNSPMEIHDICKILPYRWLIFSPYKSSLLGGVVKTSFRQ
jgi:hypothetical protein